MAEKKKAPKEPQDAKPSGGKLKLIILIVIILLVLAAGGGAAYYFLFSGSDADAESEAESPQETASEKEAEKEPDGIPESLLDSQPLIYHQLDSMTVNLSAPGPVRFLRVNMTVSSRDENVIAAVDKHLPMIRNDLLSLLSTQAFASLNSTEGKDVLRGELKEIIVRLLKRAGEPSGVQDVLFIDLVMQ